MPSKQPLKHPPCLDEGEPVADVETTGLVLDRAAELAKAGLSAVDAFEKAAKEFGVRAYGTRFTISQQVQARALPNGGLELQDTQATQGPSVPLLPNFMFRLLLPLIPTRDRQVIERDLEEQYHEEVHTFSKMLAVILYFSRIAANIVYYHFSSIRRVVPAIGIGALITAVKKFHVIERVVQWLMNSNVAK